MQPGPTGRPPHLPPNREAFTREALRPEAAAAAVSAATAADHQEVTVLQAQEVPGHRPLHLHRQAGEGSEAGPFKY